MASAILASGLALFAPPSPVPGEALPSFSWDAPEGACPSEEDVRTRLTRRLAAAHPAAQPPPAKVAAVARVRATETGFDLRLWTAEAGRLRERTLADADCSVLADAAVLLVALAIHPDTRPEDPRVADVAAAAREAQEPSAPPKPQERGPEAPGQPTREDDGPKQADPHRTRPKRPRAEGVVMAHAGVAAGALPGVGPVVRIAGGPSFRIRPRLSLRLSIPVTYEVERRGRFADREDAGADLHLVSSGVTGCVVGRLKRVRLPGCAGLEGGVIVGRGVGVAAPRTDVVAWVALPVSFGVDVGVGRFLLLSVAVEGVFPLLRTVFVVEGLGDVFRPAAAAVRALAGLGVSW